MRNRKPKRWWWLTQMIRKNGYSIGAEIGCANGDTTGRLLVNCPKLFLYAVDRWEPIVKADQVKDLVNGRLIDDQGQMAGCENWNPVDGWRKFCKAVEPNLNRVQILKGDSVEMAAYVDDKSLDFVFIDADHRYEGVLRDIKAWAPKVKDDGIITGHDYEQPRFPGVCKAVHEMFTEVNEAGVDWIWFAKPEDYVHRS